MFAALADPTRRDLIDQLASTGPTNASILAQAYPVSRQAIVKHLGLLHDAGILSAERFGNEVRYNLVAGALNPATLWMERVGGDWDRRVTALQKRLSER